MRGPDLVPVLWQLLIAALGGLAVGFEREWSARRDGGHARFGGVRTFLLLGLTGGLAAVVARELELWLGVAILAGGLALVAIAYHATAADGRIDATTEVAAVVVLAAGLLAGAGWLGAAGAVYAVTALVLVEKGRLHGWVERIRSEELEATFRFAVLALVLLPVLPSGPFGPGYGFRPREIWALVLLFSALSFAGYLALRVAGAEKGYGLAGLLGGVVSSTAVTLNFARESRRAPGQGRALALGVLAACTVLPVRLVLLSALLNREVGLAAGRLLWPSFAAGVLGLALWVTRRRFPWGYVAGLLPAGASVLATWAYFGVVVPQSFHGKQGEFAELQAGSYTASQGSWLVRELGAAGAVALLLAAAAGAWLLLRQRRAPGPLLAALCAWVLAMELFYRLVKVPFAPWYHVTTVSALLALAAWACLGAARHLARPVASPVARRALAGVLCGALMLPIAAPSLSFLAAGWRRPPDPRWEVYRRVGRLLAERTEPGRVALVEIGVVSYFAPEHPVLDLIGLVSPEAAALGAETALAAGDARYLVDASLFHRRFPFLAELGPPRWRLLAELTDPASGRGLIRVLERDPAPDAPPR